MVTRPIGERPNVAVAEGFRRLCRIADHKAGVRVRQIKSEEVDLALYAADDADGFAKICSDRFGAMPSETTMTMTPDRATESYLLTAAASFAFSGGLSLLRWLFQRPWAAQD
jgi:hypothetical protein